MRQENAYFSERNADARVQQRWNAFCESGSVLDYLQYREVCTEAEGAAYADTSDSQGAGAPHSGIR